MRILSSYIWSVLISLLAGLVCTSCIYEDPDTLGADDNGGVQLILHLNALGARVTDNSDVAEKIKSFRIIIIAENGELEINEKLTPDADKDRSNTFLYSYTRRVNPGKKRIYLIGNEESIGQVWLTSTADLPAGIPLTSLSTLLNYYRAGTESTTEGANLEKVLERLYFQNDYSIGREGNTVYLPYSAYYEITVEEDTEGNGGKLTEIKEPLHLVPAATKFDITFINYREATARVEDVIFRNANTHNFLNAQLAENEKYRSLDLKENVWWINWLNSCATASQIEGGTEYFNDLWGWITGYSMPLPNQPLAEWSFNTMHEEWVIDGLVDKNNPSKLTVGPFYVPESIQPRVLNEEEEAEKPEDERTVLIPGEQQYFLKFKVHDDGVDEISIVDGCPLSNLKALFRGTHIKVTVGLYENEVQIYAEIAPWEERKFLGYVQEDDNY